VPRSIAVSQVPCNDVLQRLRDQSGIPVIRDRRIDPTQPVSLETDLVSTRQLLKLISERLPDCDVSFTDSFVYIGPSESAISLRTLTELRQQEIDDARRQFPKDVFPRLMTRQPTEWPDLAAPRILLLTRCRDCGLTLTNAKLLPHDLWPAAELPALPFADFTTIILSQFDLTFRIDPERAELTLVPRPETVVIEQHHPVPRARRKDVEQWLQDHPAGLDANWQRATVLVTAPVEIHEQLTKLIKGDVVEETENSESLRTQLFTLRLPADTTYRQLIEQLRRSGLTIEVADELETRLDDDVPAEVGVEQMPGADFFARLFRGLTNAVDVTDTAVRLMAESDDVDE